jgi:hypothetical protein
VLSGTDCDWLLAGPVRSAVYDLQYFVRALIFHCAPCLRYPFFRSRLLLKGMMLGYDHVGIKDLNLIYYISRRETALRTTEIFTQVLKYKSMLCPFL